ncbi:hypothetical protein Franean1_4777 [Parafrankia sp. EAN1pec]|uniref:FCD domain-containing protein n=1 Tax=Parafrankia sp. (strain EAN1pec) TaxID=298653 RepID=UPI0000540E5C|nr:hypothetical protein Franean1_4777 [Frankia sp. EAN1pec]
MPRRGAFVAEVTVEDIEDHYEVVALVSGMTTRRAVRKLTPLETEELARLHREITTTEDEARRRSLDRRFFQIIATAGKSPRLDAIQADDVVTAARTSEEHVRSCAAVTVEHLRTRGYLPPAPAASPAASP